LYHHYPNKWINDRIKRKAQTAQKEKEKGTPKKGRHRSAPAPHSFSLKENSNPCYSSPLSQLSQLSHFFPVSPSRALNKTPFFPAAFEESVQKLPQKFDENEKKTISLIPNKKTMLDLKKSLLVQTNKKEGTTPETPQKKRGERENPQEPKKGARRNHKILQALLKRVF
jgi:hypothetical protein